MSLQDSSELSNWKRINNQGEIALSDISINDNIIIKGDNLDVLQILLPFYRNKIKLICIDPPYNTGGNKFNYNDNSTHDAWLNFMEERLKLAREFLSNDGIIYIHCDDRENAYLKILCDNIFGRDKFVTNLIWRKKAGGANDSQDIAIEHEYSLAYRKNQNGIFKIPLNDNTLASYKYIDDKIDTFGKYKLKALNDPSLSDSPGLHYDIECPDGTMLKANEHQWKCNEDTFLKRLNDDRIAFKKKKNTWKVYYKIYLNEERGVLNIDTNGNSFPRGRNLSSILYNVALNKDGNNDIKNLFDNDKPFSYPKPVKLLKLLIQSASKPGDIVMDFFAGSGTTGQAVLELNKKEEKRSFILIEIMDFIKDITVERLKRSLIKYNSDESFIYCENNT